MSQVLSRRYQGPVAVALLVATALVIALLGLPRAQAQTPPLCSADLYLAINPPTLTVTATPATIDANSGTSLIEARPLNALGAAPQAGCQVEIITTSGSFASTGGPTATVQTNTQGVASDSFQCDGVVGSATISGLISTPGTPPTITATTQVQCTVPALPDLSVEKSHQPDPFVYGGQGQFTLQVTNNGPGTAALFTLDDILQGGLMAVAVSNPDWQCNFPPPASVVSCVYGGQALALGGMTTLVFTVSVGSAAELPGSFENCAQVALLDGNNAPIDDADPSNDQGCDLVTVVAPGGGGPPDLSIEKRHGSLDVMVQDDTGVDFIELSCPGCTPTMFVAGLQDGFNSPSEPSSPSPALLAFIQNCSAGALQQFDPVPDNRCFGHSFTGLPNIGAATLTIALRAHPTDPLTNTDGLALQLTSGGTTFVWSIALNDLFHWATGGASPVWIPNSTFTFVLDLTALPLGGFGSPTTSVLAAINNWSFGGTGPFALTVTNNGPGPVAGFSVTDTLPPGFTYDSDSNVDWSCTNTGQTVTCTYGPTLQPGESATVIIYVVVGQPLDFTGGPVLNPVSIDVDNCATVAQLDAAGAVITDPDPSNDTVCDRVVMEGATGVVTVTIPAGTNIVSFPVEVTSAELIAAIPDLTVWFLRDGVWKVDSAKLALSLRVIIVIPVGSGIIAITDTGGTLEHTDD